MLQQGVLLLKYVDATAGCFGVIGKCFSVIGGCFSVIGVCFSVIKML